MLVAKRSVRTPLAVVSSLVGLVLATPAPALAQGVPPWLYLGGCRSSSVEMPDAVVRGDVAITGGSSGCTYSTFIPAGAHQAGAAGSQWVTDVSFLNVGSGLTTPTVYLLPRDTDNSDPAHLTWSAVGPQESLGVPDIVLNAFAESNLAAAFHVCSDGPLLVTSRTYNQSPSGTFGQGIPGVSEDQAISGDEVAWVTALDENAGFRTNVGFVNTTATTATVRVELVTSGGVSLGTVDYPLLPYGHIQRNRIFREATTDDVDNGSIRVQAVTGSVVAYASVVDNATGDGTYMLAERAQSTPIPSLAGGEAGCGEPDGLPKIAQAAPPWLRFAGPGAGYVEVPDAADLNPTDAITLEAWVYLESYSVFGSWTWAPTLVGKGYSSEYWFGINGSHVSYSGHGFEVWSDGSVPLHTWTHVAATYSDQTVRFFINGVLDSTLENYGGPIQSSLATLRIGNDVTHDTTPDGYVDEVRLWSVARSADEIASTMHSAISSPMTGLVAVWHLDGDATDAVGGHNGTLYGDAAFASDVEQEPVYLYFIPAGAHQAGAAGSQWVTDLSLLNPGSVEAGVLLGLLPRDQDNSDPATVPGLIPSGTSVPAPDAVFNDFGYSDLAAAFLVYSNQPVLVMSRTYNRSPSGTFGQGIPGVSWERANFGDHDTWLTALSESSGFRTNVGFVNIYATPATVRAELLTAAGVSLGTRDYPLPPRGYIQRNRIFREVTADEVVNGSIRVTVVTGAVIAYASVVDNATGDGTFMLAQ